MNIDRARAMERENAEINSEQERKERLMKRIAHRGVDSLDTLTELYLIKGSTPTTEELSAPSVLFTRYFGDVSSKAKREALIKVGEKTCECHNHYERKAKNVLHILDRDGLVKIAEESFIKTNKDIKHSSNISIKTILEKDYEKYRQKNETALNEGKKGENIYVSMITLKELNKNDITYSLIEELFRSSNYSDNAKIELFKKGKKETMPLEKMYGAYESLEKNQCLKIDTDNLNIRFSKNGSYKIRIDMNGTEKEITSIINKVQNIYTSYCEKSLRDT